MKDRSILLYSYRQSVLPFMDTMLSDGRCSERARSSLAIEVSGDMDKYHSPLSGLGRVVVLRVFAELLPSSRIQ